MKGCTPCFSVRDSRSAPHQRFCKMKEQARNSTLPEHDAGLLTLYDNVMSNFTYRTIFDDGIGDNYVYANQSTCPFNMIIHAIFVWSSKHHKPYNWKLNIAITLHVIDMYVRLRHSLLHFRQQGFTLEPWRKPQWTWSDACSLTLWCIQKVFVRCCRQTYETQHLLTLLHVTLTELDTVNAELCHVVKENPKDVMAGTTSLECIQNVQIQYQELFQKLTADPDNRWLRCIMVECICRSDGQTQVKRKHVQRIHDVEWSHLVPDTDIEILVREDFRIHRGKICNDTNDLRRFYVDFYFKRL